MRRVITGAIPLLLCQLFCLSGYGQELFVYTEPASNMPARSVGIRMSNWLMNDTYHHNLGYQLIPEIMWGVNRNLMLHAEGFIGNQDGSVGGEGIGLYGKYRVYASDGVNRHFRMAAFGRLSFNNSQIDQEEIDLVGRNSGYAAGFIATQLLHKQAFSSTISFVRATDNGGRNKFPSAQADRALNFSLSTGRLILPKEYTSYRQTNMNLMLEFLGQHLVGTDKTFIDIAPAVQFIFNSQTRLDIGYKYQLYSNMNRTAPNGFMIRVEHLLFNVF